MHRFGFPTPIYFGAGVRKELPDFLKSKNIHRPLLITDKGVGALPISLDVENLIKSAGLSVAKFSEVWGNPVKSQVEAGALAYKEHGADAIIGMGGGAALDVAKAVALMATHEGDLFDYEGSQPQPHPINGCKVAKWVALPTTSGTGSEVGRSAVISDEKTHIKKFIFSPSFLAEAVFADPELTLELPKSVTAATGMDALTHCVESYLAKDFHPICDGIALEGLRLAAHFLPIAVKEPGNIEARGMMMMASLMGGIAFQKDLGLTHSCAHALGTAVDMHHGLANAIMIDHALKFNVSVRADRFKIMAQTVEAKEASAKGFLQWLTDLKSTIGIPKGLEAAGVPKEKISQLADLAFQDSCHHYNPRPVSQADFQMIFNDAY